jgi:hypothetical protein
VFVREQPLDLGIGEHFGKQPGGDIPGQQPVAARVLANLGHPKIAPIKDTRHRRAISLRLLFCYRLL